MYIQKFTCIYIYIYTYECMSEYSSVSIYIYVSVAAHIAAILHRNSKLRMRNNSGPLSVHYLMTPALAAFWGSGRPLCQNNWNGLWSRVWGAQMAGWNMPWRGSESVSHLVSAFARHCQCADAVKAGSKRHKTIILNSRPYHPPTLHPMHDPLPHRYVLHALPATHSTDSKQHMLCSEKKSSAAWLQLMRAHGKRCHIHTYIHIQESIENRCKK